MPQSIQEEEKPSQSAMDQGLQKGSRQRAHNGTWVYILIVSLILIAVCYVQDSVFQFERRRNMPVKYNRDVWRKTGECSGVGVCWNIDVLHTVHAMKRIDVIRERRQARFIKNRWGQSWYFCYLLNCLLAFLCFTHPPYTLSLTHTQVEGWT